MSLNLYLSFADFGTNVLYIVHGLKKFLIFIFLYYRSRVNRKHCCHPGHPFRALSTCHNLKPEQPELLRREGYGVESSDIWSLGATFAVMFSESFVWFDTPDDGKDERLELLKRLKAGKSPNCLRKLPEPLRKALHGCFNINMQLRPCLQLLQEQLLSAKTST